MASERAAWDDFPPVIANGFIGSLKALDDYPAAKAGDTLAALRLVQALIKAETIEAICRSFQPDRQTCIVPVIAEEQSGENRIPLAFAKVLADSLGDLSVEENIVQISRVHRTGTGVDHRLAFAPEFSGNVRQDLRYIVVDDTLTLGGTLAALRAYIINRGGRVIGAAVMSGHPNALQLAPSPEILDSIRKKHGSAIDDYWNKEFNYGIEQLTQAEAAQIYAAADVDALRDRITQAKCAQRFRTDDQRTGATESACAETEGFPQELIQVKTRLQSEHPKAILRTSKPTALCCGRVVLSTENFIIQQVAEGSRYYQAHRKSDLEQLPEIGQKARITYSQNENQARVRIGGRSRSR